MYQCATKIIENFSNIDVQELVCPDKCTLPQVRNAMNMNDNIANNSIKMIVTKGGTIALLVLVSGLVFKMIEPNITNIILAKNSIEKENKEVKEDQNIEEEE